MTRLDKDGLTVQCNQCHKEYLVSPKPQTLSEINFVCRSMRSQGWWASGSGFALCPDCLRISKYSGGKNK